MFPLPDIGTAVFNFALVAGALASLLLMQLTNRYEDLQGVSPAMQWAHRLGLALTALCFLWTFIYGRDMAWSPWPPMVALIVIVVATFVLRIVMLRRAIRRIELRLQRAKATVIETGLAFDRFSAARSATSRR